MDSAALTILEDACRTVDIIDTLGSFTGGKNKANWVRLSEDAAEVFRHESINVAEVHLVVNPLIGELRSQRLALKQLLAQLRLGNATPRTEETTEKNLFERLEAEFLD